MSDKVTISVEGKIAEIIHEKCKHTGLQNPFGCHEYEPFLNGIAKEIIALPEVHLKSDLLHLRDIIHSANQYCNASKISNDSPENLLRKDKALLEINKKLAECLKYIDGKTLAEVIEGKAAKE